GRTEDSRADGNPAGNSVRRSARGAGPDEERAERISLGADGEPELGTDAAGPQCGPGAEYGGMTSRGVAVSGPRGGAPAEISGAGIEGTGIARAGNPQPFPACRK